MHLVNTFLNFLDIRNASQLYLEEMVHLVDKERPTIWLNTIPGTSASLLTLGSFMLLMTNTR